jgi:hypothetical protein
MRRTVWLRLRRCLFSVGIGTVTLGITCDAPPKLAWQGCNLRFVNAYWAGYHNWVMTSPACPIYKPGQPGAWNEYFSASVEYDSAFAATSASSYLAIGFYDDNLFGTSSSVNGYFQYKGNPNAWRADLTGSYSAGNSFPTYDQGSDVAVVEHTIGLGLARVEQWLHYSRKLALAGIIVPASAVLGLPSVWRDSIRGTTAPLSAREWRVNGVLQSGYTGSSLTYTPQSLAQLTVKNKVTNTAGGWDTASVTMPVVYTAQVVGPSSVRSGSPCTWAVQMTGGVGSLTYQWKKNAANAGTNSAEIATSFSSSGTLYIIVTDSNGNVTSSATKSITVSPSAPLCGS